MRKRTVAFVLAVLILAAGDFPRIAVAAPEKTARAAPLEVTYYYLPG